MLVVPAKVLAGTVTLCVLPETLIVWIVPLVPERQRKTAEACSKSAIQSPGSLSSQVKIFGVVFTTAPAAGDTEVISKPQTYESSTVTATYGAVEPFVEISIQDGDFSQFGRHAIPCFSICCVGASDVERHVGKAFDWNSIQPLAFVRVGLVAYVTLPRSKSSSVRYGSSWS